MRRCTPGKLPAGLKQHHATPGKDPAGGDTRCTPGKYPAGVKQLMHFTSRHQKLVFPDAETAKKSAEAKRELPFERTR